MNRKIAWGVGTLVAAGLLGGAGFWYAYQTPEARVKNAVRYKLRDPASAQFESLRAADDTGYFWCGRVNSRNGFGGMTGFVSFMVDLMPRSEYKYGIVPVDADRLIAKVDILDESNADLFLAETGKTCRVKATP